MGPEKQPIEEFYIMHDGVEVARFDGFGNGDLDVITLSGGAADIDPLLKETLSGQFTVTVSFKMGKMWRCGSRKRFIKLLMSYGCDRNTAHEMAVIVPILRGQKSYQELLFEALLLSSKMVEAAEQHERMETT